MLPVHLLPEAAASWVSEGDVCVRRRAPIPELRQKGTAMRPSRSAFHVAVAWSDRGKAGGEAHQIGRRRASRTEQPTRARVGEIQALHYTIDGESQIFAVAGHTCMSAEDLNHKEFQGGRSLIPGRRGGRLQHVLQHGDVGVSVTRRVSGAMAPQHSALQLRQALEKLAGLAECDAKCTITSCCLDPWVPHWCGLCRGASFAALPCVDSELRAAGTRATGNDGETAVGAVSTTIPAVNHGTLGSSIRLANPNSDPRNNSENKAETRSVGYPFGYKMLGEDMTSLRSHTWVPSLAEQTP